jgi:hypothetical protein
MPPVSRLLYALGASLVAACEPLGDPFVRPFVDPNGFVLNSGTKAPKFVVGVGYSADELTGKNPYLKGVISPLGKHHVVDELRLALQATTQLHYDDGDLKLNVCAHSSNADGTSGLKRGVAFVGIKLCDSPINDYGLALQRTKQVIDQLVEGNPDIQDISRLYRTAPQAELTKIGGKIWSSIATKRFKDLPAPRDDPKSMDFLHTFESAGARFASLTSGSEPKRRLDGRIDGGNALLGVYAGKFAIFEIGVNGTEAYGGSNLSKAQRNAIRYDVTMHFRLRADVDPSIFDRPRDHRATPAANSTVEGDARKSGARPSP